MKIAAPALFLNLSANRDARHFIMVNRRLGSKAPDAVLSWLKTKSDAVLTQR